MSLRNGSVTLSIRSLILSAALIGLTFFSGHDMAKSIFESGWLAGNVTTLMFMETSNTDDPYAWWIQPVAGVFSGMDISDNAIDSFGLVGAILGMGLAALFWGLPLSLIQIFLCRCFYGSLDGNRKPKYLKYTLLLNSLFVLSFGADGYFHFLNSDILFGGLAGSYFLLGIPILALLATCWVQNKLNNYACKN